ncbi:MAG: nitroreductase [Campylobacterales bacterium]|nr:nitroreductase [Campylobacterales bacterium]
MTVEEALIKRKSVRSFLKKEVEIEKIKKILDKAKHAPSGTNIQPWKAYVVSGQKQIDLTEKMVQAFRSGKEEKMEYQYYPKFFKEPFKHRRRETGLLLYSAIDIKREEKEKMKAQWEENYRSFGAPTVIYFTMDKSLETGSYLDYGMFIQSVALMATEVGLGSCIQAVLAQYPDIVREELGIKEDETVICGIALGYEDEDHKINSYRTPRVELEEFVTFVE